MHGNVRCSESVVRGFSRAFPLEGGRTANYETFTLLCCRGRVHFIVRDGAMTNVIEGGRSICQYYQRR